jgi:hypothetical protein
MPSIKKKAVPEKKHGPLIYCGPSLPRGILYQYHVSRGGLPKHLEPHFEKCPAIKRLFVPVESLNETVQAVKKSGTAESVWFKQVLEYIQGGAK